MTGKNWLLLLLQIPMLLVSSQDFVPLVLGPDFQRAYDDKDILRGFKLNVQEGENPLKAHVFDGNVESSPLSSSYTKSAVITSVDDVKEMMEIQGSLSVSYGPMISGSGAGSYLKDKVQSKRQISILYRTRRVAFAKKVNVKTLTPIDGLDRLEPDAIVEKYGSKFIDQVLYGAQLDVIFTVESSEDTDFFEIEAELKGKIGVGALSVSFEANFQKQEGYTQSRYTMNIEARASGISFPVPSNPSFNETGKLIDDFNRQYQEMLDGVAEGETVDVSNVANQFSPVAFALSPIAEYLPSKLSVEESARLDDKMETLRDIFYHALFTKSRLEKIHGEQESKYGEDPRVRIEIFQPYDDVVTDVMGEIEDNIDECLAYRKMPMRELLEPSTASPDKYASSAAEMNVLKGLVGEAYIPSPVTVDGMVFEEFHYIGFAIPSGTNDKSLVPFMSGILRRDDDDSIVASADTPEDLAALGMAEISFGIGQTYLKFGDEIFVQSSALDFRWLKRNEGSEVSIADYFSDYSLGGIENVKDYKWRVRSIVGDLVSSSDPKQGECIKYDDILFLNSNGEWLRHGKGVAASVYGIVGSLFDLDARELAGVIEEDGDKWTKQNQVSQWIEEKPSGTKIYWTEDRRDESSVYLINHAEDSTSQLDLWLGKVKYCPPTLSAYDIEGSLFDLDARELTGVIEEDGDEWTQQIGSEWIEETGGTIKYWTESHRDESSVYLRNNGEDVRLDLWLGIVQYCIGTSCSSGNVVVAFDSAGKTIFPTGNPDCVLGDIKIAFDTTGKEINPTKICTDGEGKEGICVDTAGNKFDTSSLQWRVRSAIGTGSLSDSDPAHGQCLQDLSKVYLQSYSQENSWILGAQVKDQHWAMSQNFSFESSYSYAWILRKDHGNGSTDDGFSCPAADSVGSWKPLELSTDSYYEIGIFRPDDASNWEKNKSWENSVTASVTGGFKFGPRKLSIPWIEAKEMESSVRNALKDTSAILGDSLGSGQPWQFVYDISDACVPSWELKTKAISITDSADQEPCCLPGKELNASHPHGPCKPNSVCQCEGDICFPDAPTSSPTFPPAPNSMPATATATKDASGSPKKEFVWFAAVVPFVTIFVAGLYH